MAIPAPGLAGTAAWQPVLTGDEVVAVAERDALGTSARVAIWPPGNLRHRVHCGGRRAGRA